MRIGIDARILQSELRGQGQYVYYLIDNLTKIDKDNEYIIFYNSFKKGKFLFKDNISNLKQIWYNIPGRILKPLWSNLSFPPVEYLIGKVDVFHNPINFNFTHYTPIPSKAKMVVTFNGMTDPSYIWEEYDIKKINRWFEIIAKKASKIIAVSESVKADLLSRVDISEEKIKVIYYGVDEEFKQISDKIELNKILSKYGLSGKRYILYVGAAEKNKNLSGLLSAFNIILKKNKNIYLVLVGKINSFYQGLIKEAENLRISENVIFTDYIGHDNLVFIYNGAEVFVLPTFNEWFGIPLIEAMACGTPVVASSLRGIPEVVGEAAILFNPYDIQEIADSIFRVLENKDLCDELKEKGIKRAKLFTWKKTAKETLEVYREVCKEI